MPLLGRRSSRRQHNTATTAEPCLLACLFVLLSTNEARSRDGMIFLAMTLSPVKEKSRGNIRFSSRLGSPLPPLTLPLRVCAIISKTLTGTCAATVAGILRLHPLRLPIKKKQWRQRKKTIALILSHYCYRFLNALSC